MKLMLRLLLFVLFFQADVRVRASAGSVLEEPSHCLTQENVCAVSAYKNSFHFRKGKLAWSMPDKSSVVRHSLTHLEFVKGGLWVESAIPGFSVQTLYGRIKADSGGFYISEKDGKIWFQNLDADVSVELRGGRTVNLPEGFEVWFGPVNDVGVATTGVVRPIELAKVAELIGPVFSGGKKKFSEQLVYYRDRWGDLTARAASLYKNEVLREMASIQEAEEAAVRKKRQAEEARSRQKELFLQRAFSR